MAHSIPLSGAAEPALASTGATAVSDATAGSGSGGQPEFFRRAGVPPLGPASLTWKYFGDVRLIFTFQRVAATENCIEGLAQGVEDHSVIFSDFAGRAQRSLPPVMRTVYGENGSESGHQVRDFHKPIKGKLADGSRYHALSPELYYWAHATFLDGMIHATDTFIRRLSYAEKAQMFEESKEWYARYGVSASRQPDSYEEFLEYWDNMEAQFINTRTIRYGTGYLRKGLPRPKQVPRPVWALLSRPLNATVRTIVIGTLTPRIREVCELPWGTADERRFQRFAALVRATNPLVRRLPVRMTYMRWANEAWEREGVDPRPLNNGTAR